MDISENAAAQHLVRYGDNFGIQFGQFSMGKVILGDHHIHLKVATAPKEPGALGAFNFKRVLPRALEVYGADQHKFCFIIEGIWDKFQCHN